MTSPHRLGATPTPAGTRFEVWAPDARAVDVVVERAGGTQTVPLARRDAPRGPTSDLATWVGVVDGVVPGDRYRYSLDGGEPLPDPASRHQPEGVHGASAVVDTDSFLWTDDEWSGVTLADTVLYEMHVGTFTSEGTFDAAIHQLPRLVDLGITAIEVMPVNAFPGERNWGYDGVFPFATQHSYGGPHGFARFVDAAHAHELAVVLDVVYNHFGPEGNVLPRFGQYLTDDYSTPWGGAVNVSGKHSDSVRRYFVENAAGWIRDFHVDGLRLDAIHAIVDPTARPFVDELTSAVHRAGADAGRTVLVTVESSSNDPRFVRPHAAGGWNCDAVWNDDFHHALRVAVTGERHEYYRAYDGASHVAEALVERFVFHGQHSINFGRRHGADASDIDHRRFIVFGQNHDHVGNTPRGHRLLHDAGPGDPRLRLVAAAVVHGPFTPMLFMGEEYGERAPFPYFIDHGDPDLVEAVRQGRQREFSGVDWSGGVADPAAPETFADAVLDPTCVDRSDDHAELLAWYRHLLALRRKHAVLTDPAADHRVEFDGSVITVERQLGDASSVLTLNLGDTERDDPSDDAASIVADSISGSDPSRLTPWAARLRVTSGARHHT